MSQIPTSSVSSPTAASPSPAVSAPRSNAEAFEHLRARVGRKSGKIPAEFLVGHVLAHVPASEWPARVEAIDALLRRIDSAEALRIETRPANGRRLGLYTTRRSKSSVRPYQTVLSGVDPIAGRCDCPDFLKNSLGVCKHLFVVLEAIVTGPRTLKEALGEQASRAEKPFAGLVWDPIRPFTGAGDWLERVAWIETGHGNGNGKRNEAENPARGSRSFRADGLNRWVPRRTFRDNPAQRLALVEELQALLPSANSAAARGPAADPALRALLAADRARLLREIETGLNRGELRAAFKGLKKTLYHYQREGVRRFLETGRLVLADDMGLGKTAQAIASVDILWRTGRIRRGLIIAPAALKPQWAREWDHFSDLPIQVVEGAPAERQAMYDATRREGLLIINYEQLIRDLDAVRQWKPDVVVIDEAQRIKNWATKTALSVKRLNPTYRLVLTGTPMENRIEELASVVEWVDDQALEPKWRLGAVHTIRGDGKKEVVGVRHLDTLRERLRPCMVRRVRQEVLDQLPPRTDTRVPIEMTEPQVARHDELIPPIAALIARAKARPLTQAEFLRLMMFLTTQRIISNGLAQIDFEQFWPALRNCAPEESVLQGLSAPKLLELRQLIRQLVLEQGRKVVVFSQWRRMLTLAQWAVSDLLAGNGLRSGFFTGQEGQRRRTQNIVEFHDDPSLRILFASDAGGVGLNLQRAANCVINLELPWNPAVLEQRIGRVYRLGQTLPIDVFNLVSEYGIESRIAGLVGSKQAFFKGLFDGESDSVKFDESGSFLARVEKIYDAKTLEFAASLGDGEEALPDARIDDVVVDPFEPILEAADESDDRPAQALPETSAAVAQQEPVREPTAADQVAPAEVRRLFAQLEFRRESSGKIVIEAPPEAASTLAALFEGMAALLHGAAGGAGAGDGGGGVSRSEGV